MRFLALSTVLLTAHFSQQSLAAQAPEPLRTWTDATGAFNIKARFVKLSGGDLVVLQPPGKEELNLPLARLSPSDQTYARNRHALLERYRQARMIPPGADLASIIASARPNTVLRLAAGTYRLRATPPHDQGVLIEKKRGLIITGAGRDKTTIMLAPDIDVGLLIGDQVHDLTIENLHIQGTPPLKTNTAGIGSTSLCSDVKNVRLRGLRVDHVAIGIFMATSKGPVNDIQITHNIISDTQGTEAGWGYGIHTRKIGNVLISHNYIERATRHSIYIRESPARSQLTVEDNFILNHDLEAANPRWYCAALNCPGNRSITRIAHNYFMNPKAVGIAVMTTTDNLSLVNNQIIGEHYIGIWPVTGKTHTALANSVLLHTNPPRPEWSHKISSFDWPNNKESNSQLEAPNARWTEPDFSCHLAGTLYILKNGTLDRIDPGNWSYQTCPTQWKDAKGICAVPDVRGTGARRLYVVTSSALFEINPDTWQFQQQAGDWATTRFVSATANRIHILDQQTLHSIDLTTLAATQAKQDWSKATWMCAWDDQLYLFDGKHHYRVDPNSQQSTLISQSPAK